MPSSWTASPASPPSHPANLYEPGSVACQMGSDFQAVRARSLALIETLSPEDCGAQSMPQASPAKWHLAHSTWFFETFVLQRWERPFKPHNAAWATLFNSYYQSIGQPFARALRGLLTRPSLAQVLEWRSVVDQRVLALLQSSAPTQTPDSALHALITLGLHHEQQHQELLLTDIKHLFSLHPELPAYQASPPQPSDAPPQATAWLRLQGGLVEIGHQGPGFCFDNELPRHASWLAPYEIGTQPVCNGQWCRFIEAGGYQEPEHWLAEGWDWRCAEQRSHPLYWQKLGPPTAGTWCEFTLGGRVPLDMARPVSHLSYFEADAYARWAGARLPTEQEWEHAAHWVHASQAQSHRWALHPPAPLDAQDGLWLGGVWEWTQSSYAPYPGYTAPPGAVGEYNGKFMVNQYVLRGGSCVSPVGHLRSSYRNFFPSSTCWQFSGLRLARDCV